MKKNVLLLVSVLLISVFIYGVLVGTYKIFPYDQLDSVKSITLNEKTISKQQNIIYENNVAELINIKNSEDISKIKTNLIDFIWKDLGFPYSKLPDYVNLNINNLAYSDFSNLKTIDELNIEMEYGVNSISYLFTPELSNNKFGVFYKQLKNKFIFF